jgi:hypothetical protein
MVRGVSVRNKRWTLFALVLALVLATACEGGTSGSVVGSRQSCNYRMGSGTCKGSYRKLSGTYSEDIENDGIYASDAIQVRVEVSVESGVVRVSIKSPDGEVLSVDASPAQPATLTGIAGGFSEEFRVQFQAVDGEAAGVSYDIAYQVP